MSGRGALLESGRLTEMTEGNCNAPRGRRYTRKMKNVCESMHVSKGDMHPLMPRIIDDRNICE